MKELCTFQLTNQLKAIWTNFRNHWCQVIFNFLYRFLHWGSKFCYLHILTICYCDMQSISALFKKENALFSTINFKNTYCLGPWM